MKKLACFLFVLYHLFSCSSIQTVDEPDPTLTPGQTETEIEIVLGAQPDSIRLGRSIHFSMSVIQSTPASLFNLTIDTTGKFKLEIDDKEFSQVKSLLPDLSYNVEFTPQEEGYAGITFLVVNEEGDSCMKAIELYTYSPQPTIEFSSSPDTLRVSESAEFRFTVKGVTGEEYTLHVDTVIPEFRVPLAQEISGKRELLHRGVTLSVNGRPLVDSIKLRSGYTNIFRFSEPQAIGDYHVSFTCTDKRGKVIRGSKRFHVHSTEEIIVQFYNVDPQKDLEIEKENFYEILNRDYSHSPLSPVFQDQETDSVSWHIPPQEVTNWQFVGKGLTFHIEQKGNTEFYFPSDGITYDKANAPLTPEIDGRDIRQTQIGTGFHGMLFFYEEDRPCEADITYRLTVFDRWGQKRSIDLPVHTY